jgi:flavin-dependent dehydrogenase
LAIARRLLDATLVDAARDAGATVHERTTLSALLQDGHGAVQGAVIRQDGRDTEIRARVVIGADGLRSRVARTIGERKHGWLRRTAFVAHVADVPGLHRSAEMHVSGRGYVGLNPIGGGIANVALLMPASIAKQAAGRVEDFFFEQLDAIPGVRGRVRREAVVREILVTGPFAATSTRVTTDGCMLIGDAADFFDPFTGEGICTALRGAELAARHLPAALDGTATATQRALAGYRADRRRLFAGKWAVERLIGWSMQWPALFDHAVGRLQRRGMAHTLVGVTADFVPARAVLNPLFLARMLF